MTKEFVYVSPEGYKIKPGSFWLIQRDGEHDVCTIAQHIDQEFGFFVPRSENLFPFNEVQKWIAEIQLPE